MRTTTPRVILGAGAEAFVFVAEEASFAVFGAVKVTDGVLLTPSVLFVAGEAFRHFRSIFFAETFEEAGDFGFVTALDGERIGAGSEIFVIKRKGKPAVIPM